MAGYFKQKPQFNAAYNPGAFDYQSDIDTGGMSDSTKETIGVGLGMIPDIAFMSKRRKDADKMAHANLMSSEADLNAARTNLAINQPKQQKSLQSRIISGGNAGTTTASNNMNNLVTEQQGQQDSITRQAQDLERNYRYGKRQRKENDWANVAKGAAALATAAFF